MGRQHGLSEDRRKFPHVKKQRRYSPSRASGLTSGGTDNIVYGGTHNLLRSGMEGKKDDIGSTLDDEVGCCEEESDSCDEADNEVQSNRECSPAP